MSDSDNWEKFAENDDDSGLDKILKTGKFGDELTKPEEPKPVQPAEEKKTKMPTKPKKGKTGTQPVPEKPKSEAIAEGKRKEEIADNELTEELFGVSPVTVLSNDDNYLDFAREVSRRLAKGQSHYKLPIFFGELFKEISKLMKIEEINQVITQVSVIHSERVKAEKPVKKTNKKPGLKMDSQKIEKFEEQDDYNEYEDFL